MVKSVCWKILVVLAIIILFLVLEFRVMNEMEKLKTRVQALEGCQS